jgi:hypothetical protein
LLLIIALEALSRLFRTGLPWELMYADDLALLAESGDKSFAKLRQWKCGFEVKSLKVNIGKTKVMRCSMNAGVRENLESIHAQFARKL